MDIMTRADQGSAISSFFPPQAHPLSSQGFVGGLAYQNPTGGSKTRRSREPGRYDERFFFLCTVRSFIQNDKCPRNNSLRIPGEGEGEGEVHLPSSYRVPANPPIRNPSCTVYSHIRTSFSVSRSHPPTRPNLQYQPPSSPNIARFPSFHSPMNLS
jgi:hypothetical protein